MDVTRNAIAALRGQARDLLQAIDRLADSLAHTEAGELDGQIEIVTHIVALYWRVPYDRMIGRDASRDAADARHVAMALCCELTKASRQRVAIAFGKTAREAVAYAVKKVSDLAGQPGSFADDVAACRDKARAALAARASAPSA